MTRKTQEEKQVKPQAGKGKKKPYKLDQVKTSLLKHIADGNFIETACRLAGVSRATFYNWKALAENEDLTEKERQPYIELFDEIDVAEAKAEAKRVAQIRSAGTFHWQAAAWYLERKHPERWGKNETLNLNHGGGVKVEQEESELERKLRDNPEAAAHLAALYTIGKTMGTAGES